MTTIHDTIKALLERRAACVAEVSAIDRELAAVQSTVTNALAHITPVPAAAADDATAPPPSAARTAPAATHDQARRSASQAIRFAREISTALVGGRLSSREIAKKAGQNREDVKRSLTLMLNAGRVVKIGKRGPSVRWELPGAVALTLRRVGTEYETVFPQPGNPKASPREAIAGAHA